MAVDTSGIARVREPANLGPGIQNLQLAFKQGVLTAEEIANALTTGPSGRQLQRAQNIAALELLPVQQQVAQGQLQSQAALQPGQANLAQLQLQGQTMQAEQGLQMLPGQFQLQELRTQDDVNQLEGLLGAQPFASPENAQSFFAATHPNEKIPEDPKKLAEVNFETFKAIQQFRTSYAAAQKPRTEEVILQDPVTFDKKRFRLTLDAQGNVTSRTELGLVESGEKPLTENQAKTAQYASRMEEARGVFEALSAGGFDPTTKTAFLGTYLNQFAPLAKLTPVEIQQYEAAKDNWIAAVLRQESGATITPSEKVGARFQYFPRVGDAPEVVAQKAKLRLLAEENMRKISEVGRPRTAVAAPAAPAPREESLPLQPPPPPVAPAVTPQAIPTVRTRAETAALPPTVEFFLTPSGRVLKNPNFKPAP